MIQHVLSENTAKVGDVITFAAAVGVVVGYIPVVVGFATLLWTVIRIYETETVTKLIVLYKAWRAR